jgi:hypothetical protein
MEITTVKLQQNGYFVNGEIFVPQNNTGYIMKAVQKWLKTNTPDVMYDLEETRKNKLTELDKQYKNDVVRTVEYEKKNIIVNNGSLNGINSKMILVENDTNITSINWYFDDGNVTSLTLDNLKTLQKLIANKDQLLRDIKYEHTQAIEMETDIDLLDSYDITANINTLSWS